MAKKTPLRSDLLKKEAEYVKISSAKWIPNVPDLDYSIVLIMETKWHIEVV
jgi:hypothetical protein